MTKPYDPQNPLLKVLTETKLSDLPFKPLLKFNTTDLIKDVFETLTKADVLSAPVYDAHKKEYMGMVDFRDFIDFVMTIHMKGERIIFTAERLSDLSGSNPFIPIPENTTLVEALREFNIRKVHRMPVSKHGESSNILYLLTESAIVEWLYHHKDKLGEHGNMTIKQLGLGGIDGFHQVLSIKESDSVLAALSIISKHNVHGLPVIDAEGKLVGNISVRDLKHMVATDLTHLGIPIKEFFAKYTGPRPSLLTCSPSTKFVDIISMIAESKVHRVHVVDSDFKPVDIISLGNILDISLLFATGIRRK